MYDLISQGYFGSFLSNGAILKGEIADYSIIKSINTGGFGIIYLAKVIGQNHNLPKIVAIKEFFPNFGCGRVPSSAEIVISRNDRKLLALKNQFIKEATTLRRLSHPRIIPVYDVFQQNGTYYYSMKYIAADAFSDCVRFPASEEDTIAEKKAIEIISSVADGLQYLHDNGIIHCDVKPSNIIYDPAIGPVLIDFGVLYNMPTPGKLASTVSSNACFTPGFAPLELSQTLAYTLVCPATDVYSLAATLYKLLTGAAVPNAVAIFNEGLDVSPLIKAGVSASTIAAIKKAMAPAIKDRYQSVTDFIKALNTPSLMQPTISGIPFEKNTMLTRITIPRYSSITLHNVHMRCYGFSNYEVSSNFIISTFFNGRKLQPGKIRRITDDEYKRFIDKLNALPLYERQINIPYDPFKDSEYPGFTTLTISDGRLIRSFSCTGFQGEAGNLEAPRYELVTLFSDLLEGKI